MSDSKNDNSQGDPVATDSPKLSKVASTGDSRTARIEKLLDDSITALSAKVKAGKISASIAHEILALARAAGVEIAQSGTPLTPAFDPILESLKNIDPAILEPIDYHAKTN